MKTVRAFAPATVANVACGFDVLGFALDKPGDIVSASLSSEPGVIISAIHGDGGRLPLEAEKNTAGLAVITLLQALDSNSGICLELDKQLPLCSGLGSSGASAVAALLAVNELLGKPMDRKQLLPFAVRAEELACGAAHADNVAPSLLGGFTLVRSTSPLDVIHLPYPTTLCCAVFHPELELATEDSRTILPSQVELDKAVQQSANLGALVAGLATDNFSLISRSLQDVLAEPFRKKLIPYFEIAQEAALAAGALGCSLSGSGPSIFALCNSSEIAESAGNKIRRIYSESGVNGTVYLSGINSTGGYILSNESAS